MVTKRSKHDKVSRGSDRRTTNGIAPPEVRGKHAAPANDSSEASHDAASVTPEKEKGARIPQNQSPRPRQHRVPQGQPSPRHEEALASDTSGKTVNAQAAHSVRGAVYSRKDKKKRIPTPVKVFLSVALVAVIAFVGFLAWDGFFRYDDAADFQGQWKIEGTNASIVITEDEIRLTDSVSFTYELNTLEKTITYSFANYTGAGMYEFSPERDVLTLTDVNPDPDEEEGSNRSMNLLKVSDEAVGEPEVANNNTTENADTAGVDVVDGSETAQQAEESE